MIRTKTRGRMPHRYPPEGAYVVVKHRKHGILSGTVAKAGPFGFLFRGDRLPIQWLDVIAFDSYRSFSEWKDHGDDATAELAGIE